MFAPVGLVALVTAAFAVVAGAAPIPSPGAAVAVTTSSSLSTDAAADGNLVFCTGTDFTGDCADFTFTSNVCFNFSTEFQDDINSISPDPDITCTVFVDDGCSGQSLTIESPGIDNLAGVGLQNTLSSFICNNT